MAKLTAWVITIIGIILVLGALDISLGTVLDKWLIPLLVLIAGIGKLMRNYSDKLKKR